MKNPDNAFCRDFLYLCPMKHTYYPKGTCSQVIEFEIVDGKIHNV